MQKKSRAQATTSNPNMFKAKDIYMTGFFNQTDKNKVHNNGTMI